MKYAHSLEVDPCGIFSTITVSGTIVSDSIRKGVGKWT